MQKTLPEWANNIHKLYPKIDIMALVHMGSPKEQSNLMSEWVRLFSLIPTPTRIPATQEHLGQLGQGDRNLEDWMYDPEEVSVGITDDDVWLVFAEAAIVFNANARSLVVQIIDGEFEIWDQKRYSMIAGLPSPHSDTVKLYPVYEPSFTKSTNDLTDYVKRHSSAGCVDFSMGIPDNTPSTTITSMVHMIGYIPFYNNDGDLNPQYLEKVYEKYAELADRTIAEMSYEWAGARKTFTPDSPILSVKSILVGDVIYDDMVALMNHVIEKGIDLKDLTWLLNSDTGLVVQTMKDHDGIYCCGMSLDGLPSVIKITDVRQVTEVVDFVFNEYMSGSDHHSDESGYESEIRRCPIILGDTSYYHLYLSDDYKCEVLGSDLHISIKVGCEYDSSKFVRLQTTG